VVTSIDKPLDIKAIRTNADDSPDFASESRIVVGAGWGEDTDNNGTNQDEDSIHKALLYPSSLVSTHDHIFLPNMNEVSRLHYLMLENRQVQIKMLLYLETIKRIKYQRSIYLLSNSQGI